MPGRSIIHYSARSRIKNMLWPTLESLSLVSVNERETIWAQALVDIMPWDCGLSIQSPPWELFHLSIPNIGFQKRYSLGGKKFAIQNANYNSKDTPTSDPGYPQLWDAKALSRPGTECLTILLAGKVTVFLEACDLWMNMLWKLDLINLTSYWRCYQGGQNCQREPRMN